MNLIDQTPFFVRQHYLDFPGREPEPVKTVGFGTGRLSAPFRLALPALYPMMNAKPPVNFVGSRGVPEGLYTGASA